MPGWLPDLLVFLALALVTAGVALINLPIALIVCGLGLAIIAWRLGVSK